MNTILFQGGRPGCRPYAVTDVLRRVALFLPVVWIGLQAGPAFGRNPVTNPNLPDPGELLISEFATQNADKNADGKPESFDMFIELYNPLNTPVNIAGIRVQYLSGAATDQSGWADVAVLPGLLGHATATFSLVAGQHYLIARTAMSDLAVDAATVTFSVPAVYYNNVQSLLTANVGSADTVLPVVNTSGFPTSGFAQVELETIKYTGVTPTSLTGLTRGVGGTVAASHVAGFTVWMRGFDPNGTNLYPEAGVSGPAPDQEFWTQRPVVDGAYNKIPTYTLDVGKATLTGNTLAPSISAGSGHFRLVYQLPGATTVEVDKVGWGSSARFAEGGDGVTAGLNTVATQAQSNIKRQFPWESTARFPENRDTNNSKNDFILLATRNPQNMKSPVVRQADLVNAGTTLTVERKPFSPALGQTLKLAYKVSMDHTFTLTVFDLQGRVVRRLAVRQPGGDSFVNWDGRDEELARTPAGMYVVFLEDFDADGRRVGTRLAATAVAIPLE